MSELWYDINFKKAEGEFGLDAIMYNYGEDLQVLREEIQARKDDYDDMSRISRELEDANIAKVFEITQSQEEIAALKKVAEAAKLTYLQYQNVGEIGHLYHGKLGDTLREAGYLKEQGDE